MSGKNIGAAGADAKTVTFEVTEAGHALLKESMAASGQTQKACMTRLVEWFTRQDKTVQAIITRQLEDEDVPVAAAMALRRMLQGDEELQEKIQSRYHQVRESLQVPVAGKRQAGRRNSG